MVSPFPHSELVVSGARIAGAFRPRLSFRLLAPREDLERRRSRCTALGARLAAFGGSSGGGGAAAHSLRIHPATFLIDARAAPLSMTSRGCRERRQFAGQFALPVREIIIHLCQQPLEAAAESVASSGACLPRRAATLAAALCPSTSRAEDAAAAARRRRPAARRAPRDERCSLGARCGKKRTASIGPSVGRAVLCAASRPTPGRD